MADKLPEHVIKQYGSSRAFRARKRKALRDLERALLDLRLGSAYFPNGSRGVRFGGADSASEVEAEMEAA